VNPKECFDHRDAANLADGKETAKDDLIRFVTADIDTTTKEIEIGMLETLLPCLQGKENH